MNNNDNEILLYNKVWSNSYLKFKIINELCNPNIVVINDIDKLRDNKDSIIHELVIEGSSKGEIVILENQDIPTSVIKLNLAFNFQQELTTQLFANNVNIKSLKFRYFNQKIFPNSLPPNLKSLYLGRTYNTEFIMGGLPSSIESLSLGSSYNLQITPHSLPPNLKRLSLGLSFNLQIYQNSLPSSLTYLSAYRYDKPILPNSLPSSIETLEFQYFNQNILAESLPESLTVLNLMLSFNKPIERLPLSLTDLKLSDLFNQKLRLGSNINLTSLKVGYGYDQDFEYGDLPESLVSLRYGSNSSKLFAPSYIPPSVQFLYFGFLCEKQISSYAIQTTNIKMIVFSNEYNSPILPNSLPNNLEHLEFGNQYDKPFTNDVLPPNLKTLILGKDFNQLITPHQLPNSITYLSFGDNFKRYIRAGSIGSNVEYLIFGPVFFQRLTSELIPKSVIQLTVSNKTKIDQDLKNRESLTINYI